MVVSNKHKYMKTGESRCNNLTSSTIWNRHWPLLFLLSALGLWSAGSLLADVVLVESRTGSATTAFPPYADMSVGPAWAASSLKSSAGGTTSTRGGSRYIQTNSTSPAAGWASFKVQPTLGEAGGSYYVEVTHGSATSVSPDMIAAITTVGGSGLPATTDGFQQAKGVNSWYRIGTLKLDAGQTTPTITFAYQSGNVYSGTPYRFYADAVRFINTNTVCLLGLPELDVVNGPLAAGQTSVSIPGVSGSATNLSVYMNGLLIGTKSSGIVAGVNTVTTTPLVKGQQITVSQWANGVESCRPAIGINVGGGANPRICIALSIRQNPLLFGPIGANGGSTGTKLVFLGSSGVVGGAFGVAPSEGKVVYPSACWQTVTFLRGTDPAHPVDPTYAWSGSDGTNQVIGDFGVLESIALAIDDLTDTGPFQIYIDNLMNGNTVIQDFESATNGQSPVLFMPPSTSGSTSPFLLAPSPGSILPNVAQVTTNNADTGSNAVVVSWQFKDVAAANWLRLLAQGSNTPNPEVDLRLPISFRILLLPVGQAVGNSSVNITSQPTGANVHFGDDVIFTVGAVGQDIAYQWRLNGVDIPGANYYQYEVFPEVQDFGLYTCVVSGPSCSVTSQVAVLGLIGDGNGLSGQYFSGQAKTFNDPPTLMRLDPTVNFDWGTGFPDMNVTLDHFTVRWAGQVQPLTSDTYTFYTTTDDGVRLWVNGVLVIDKWIDQAATEWAGSINLMVGQQYDLRMEYYENTGSASAILKWSAPGLAKSVIPQSQFYTVAPYLNTQPTNWVRHYGESATFSVDAGGTQLAYQWLKNDLPIPGAYSNSYTINPVVCDSAGTYKVIVANGAGSVTSDPGVLTTIIETTEVSGPANQTVVAGSSATLTAVASPGPVSYVWRKDGQLLAGQTTNSLVWPSVTTNEAGLYCVEVTGPCNSATNCATLTVQQPSPPPQPNVGGLAYDAKAGTFGFSFGTTKDVTYLIEYTDKFESPSTTWNLLQTVVGDGNAAAISDSTEPLPPIRFYRVRVATTP